MSNFKIKPANDNSINPSFLAYVTLDMFERVAKNPDLKTLLRTSMNFHPTKIKSTDHNANLIWYIKFELSFIEYQAEESSAGIHVV